MWVPEMVPTFVANFLSENTVLAKKGQRGYSGSEINSNANDFCEHFFFRGGGGRGGMVII